MSERMLVSTDSAYFGGTVRQEPRARAWRGHENLLAMADGDLYDDDCGGSAEER